MGKLSFTVLLIFLALLGRAQMSPHGSEFKSDCKLCHTSESWKVSKTIMSFDHNTTSFSLTGQHKAVDCISCHKTLKFKEAESQCISCHKDLHQNTLGTDCARCHTSNSWLIKSSVTLHKSTRFPLEGSHAVVECASCHKSASNYQYEPLGVECVDCHRKDYLSTTNPNHVKNGYPTNCVECHSVNATNWNSTNFNHSAFPLTEGHNIGCVECHTSGNYQKLASDCMSCHQIQFKSAKGHVESKFSADCKTCHNSANWLGANFNHTTTNFPLTGSHLNVQCASCHTTGYVGTSMECKSCHQTKYNSVQQPSHTASGISMECKTCHTTNDWKPSSFNHNTTGYNLTGSHVTILQCSSCHVGNTTSAKQECKACHQTKYNAAQVPSHTAAGISVECKTCHTTTDWKPSSFNHTTTGFTLTGGHAAVVQCSSCHKGNTTSAQSDCISCHQTQYNGAKDHVASKFPTNCTMCHNSNNWLNPNFNHSLTNFPLTGAHVSAECASCHTAGYAGTSMECKSCHQAKYNAAQVPSHTAAGISVECKTCHTTTDWKPSSFNHTTTGFALTGGHTAIVQCSACHKGNTTSAQSDCISCHQAQYNGAKDHVASKFPTNCTMCHNSNNWLNPNFNHSLTNFPLTGAHVSAECASCHTAGYAGTSMECKSCHQTKYNAAQVPSHTAAGISVECKTCHTTTDWKPSSFNHTTTGFTLSGGHAAVVQCSACHKGNTTSSSPDCISCHQAQYNGAKDHVASKFPTNCTMCHNSNNWLNPNFNHSLTNFPLTGSHISAECASCHTAGYAGTSMECKACHQAKYNSAQVPSHTTAGISVECKTCHTTTDWKPSSFNHTTTGFTLSGGHAAIVQCSSCHKGNTTSATPDCKTCHQTNYNTALAPSHTAAGISVDCKICHTATAWKPSSFNHTTTGFVLTGGHAAVIQCSACHKGNTTSAQSDCISCHQAQYNGAKDHVASKFPTNCTMCHNSNNWLNPNFNHSLTNFPLTGSHIGAECASCHTAGYAGTSMECKSCHQTKYNAAQVPSHTAAGISVECKTCHTTTDWKPSTFNHTTTGFALNGGHTAVIQCSACHKGNTTSATPDCISCHQAQYNGAKDHVASKFPTNCTMCHNSNNWLNPNFNHSLTNFPLTGAHISAECASCHTAGYAGTSMECKACHQAKYTAAQVPSHTAAGISVECKTCHTTTDWKPSSFNHTTTGFALTGGHAAVIQCSACHKGNTTSATPDCISCHHAQYNGAKDHVASKFPTNCTMCHNSNNWLNPNFNHSLTNFPLTGSHIGAECASCHTAGYAGTSMECKACHQAKYTAAQVPSHTTAGISVECKTCHTTTDWKPSMFNHTTTGFTLTGGHAAVVQCSACHKGNTTSATPDCKTCHQTNYNTALVPSHTAAGISVECITCHTSTAWKPSTFNHTTTGFVLTGGHTAIVQCSSCHKGNTTSAKSDCISCHQVQYNGAPGHVASKFPTDCKLCHSSNNWLGATFNHSLTAFPLTGSHTTVECVSCHTTGYAGTSMECKSCHQANYNAAVDPNHKTLALPLTCADCHTTNADWKPASFAIHNNYYALTGAHSAIAKDCAACHKGSYTNTPNTCNGCHAADYNTAANPNHKTAQFPTDCASCHTSNAWAPSTFNHDAQYFPIYSGKHREKWTLCSECHTSTTNFALFICIKCHEHSSKTSVDEDHKEVNGYAYNATSCYSCHPTGRN